MQQLYIYDVIAVADDVGPAPDVVQIAPSYVGNTTFASAGQNTIMVAATRSIGGMMVGNY